MGTSTFTIEFLPHLPRSDWQRRVDDLSEIASDLTEVDERTFVITCSRWLQLNRVGWLLFHTSLAEVCRVRSTTGDASSNAGAYHRDSLRRR